jgi:CMP-N-acetylneuraminic acid synthetase
MKKVVAYIHAKGESTRLPNKNMKLLNGKPLVSYAIIAAMEASLVTEVCVDSDSEEILDVGRNLGARVLKRPKELANNNISGDDLICWQAYNAIDSDCIVQVVPTCPFTKSSSINNAIALMEQDPCLTSVIGVRKEPLYTWVNGNPSYRKGGRLPTSNTLQRTIYETMGLYVTRTKNIITEKVRVTNACQLLELSAIEAIDINTEEDFEFAEIVARGMSK